jgi:hypothetical protein
MITNENISDLIKCLNCKRIYDDPKLLPCGYTICKSCLTECLTLPQVNCKYCSTTHFIIIDDLKSNQCIIELINSIEKRTLNLNIIDNTLKQNSYINNNDNYSLKIEKDINEQVNFYLKSIGEKIEFVNYSYTEAKSQIEGNCHRVVEEINKSVENLINLILEKKYLMLKDVESRKVELLIDFKEKYEKNLKVEQFRNEIKTKFMLLLSEFNNQQKNLISDQEIATVYMEKIQMLNSKIDENIKYIPLNIDAGIIFTKADQSSFITVPIIGDVSLLYFISIFFLILKIFIMV